MTLHEFLDCHYGEDGEEVLRRMLDDGADPNMREGSLSETALHVATRLRRDCAVDILLARRSTSLIPPTRVHRSAGRCMARDTPVTQRRGRMPTLHSCGCCWLRDPNSSIPARLRATRTAGACSTTPARRCAKSCRVEQGNEPAGPPRFLQTGDLRYTDRRMLVPAMWDALKLRAGRIRTFAVGVGVH